MLYEQKARSEAALSGLRLAEATVLESGGQI